MFGLGMPEILMILAIALIVIGPQKLPEVARTLGKAMGEFKRSAQELKNAIDTETTVNDTSTISAPGSGDPAPGDAVGAGDSAGEKLAVDAVNSVVDANLPAPQQKSPMAPTPEPPPDSPPAPAPPETETAPPKA